ncbi:holo-ACP synthase [Buchnera aphidicola (Thelaxes californica)]|uniref:Holo-[acyl-carrier-protein] synthase n=1 Tax=Buchnera aphidicola (Thelaxes californica) TaxID=1315998 RepID=A0A4D6YCB3_9GAMM|nr:holo-ACP synthase [Buchnera aphidicola]QCI26732.1 holo-ACP synthase [Buchnera aphidicola (Thelaxes californica)]
MTIIGTGIDILSIKRIEKIFTIYGNLFAKKILSNYEWTDYLKSFNPINFLCKKFSGKEAISKALGIGMQYGVTWKQIEIKNDIFGKPYVQFYGKTKFLIQILQIKKTHITFSDEKKYTIASVILEK